MKHIPNLTEGTIRDLSTSKSWARGEGIYYNDNVSNIIWRGNVVTAAVQGSSYEPYTVTIVCDDNGIKSTDCTCPYDWGGVCKHVVAVLLCLLQKPESVAVKQPIDLLLAGLDRDRLAKLVTQLAELHPVIVEDIELLAPVAEPEKKIDSAEKPPSPTVDTRLLRRQIIAEIRSLGTPEYGYDAWGGDSWYDINFSSALDPALERAQAAMDAGDPRTALVILEAAAEAWDEGMDTLDEYVRETFEDFADDFTIELGELWARALLTADLTSAEREQWEETTLNLSETVFGGSGLYVAYYAAGLGWDYPPLVAAMQGNITEKGAWADERPFCADALARIRLDILDQQDRHEEYLNLAQAEGEFMRYLHMLVRVGRSEKAVAEATTYLTQPVEIHDVAKTLADNDEIEKAFVLARHGLELDNANGKGALGAWLRDLARTQHNPELALWAARQALASELTLVNYVGVMETAGNEWDTIRAELLAGLSKGHGSADNKVDIYLYENMHAEAIHVVDNARWFYPLDKVIEAVKRTHPKWAFRQCCQQAEEIMDAGRAKDYDVAVSWLRRGRDIMLAADMTQTWVTYRDAVLEKHHRKYKLVPMVRALG